MVYKNKGKFVLEKQCLQGIVDDILELPNNKDVKVLIEQSPHKYSKSLYAKFYIGDYSTCLRISDHECKSEIRQIIVTESTGIANVYYKIDRAIKDLRFKRLQCLLNKGAL